MRRDPVQRARAGQHARNRYHGRPTHRLSRKFGARRSWSFCVSRRRRRCRRILPLRIRILAHTARKRKRLEVQRVSELRPVRSTCSGATVGHPGLGIWRRRCLTSSRRCGWALCSALRHHTPMKRVAQRCGRSCGNTFMNAQGPNCGVRTSQTEPRKTMVGIMHALSGQHGGKSLGAQSPT